jgi:thioester reductase-like protein
VYDELKNSITLIIHNAWNLNFNLSLSSFETHVRGVRNLIDLGRASRHASSLRFLFTSSIASTQSWDTLERGPCPEDVIMDVSCAVGMGYGEGKYVSERILAKSGLHATSFRIGQITGGMPNGTWAMSDWFPMLVKSSLKLQMFPDAHGVISWIPPNAVAEVIVHFGLSEGGSPPAVVNLVHPHPIAWSQMIRDVRSVIITVKNLDTDALPLVPFRTWAEALENFAGVAGIENEVPAAKIIDFFQRMAQEDERNKSGRKDVEAVGMTCLATDYIQRLSSRIHNLTPISGRDAERWVRYWERSGL